MSMDKCRLHILAHSLRHSSQFFGLFHPVASVRTRFHCFRFLAPTFCLPFSSSTGMRIPYRSGFFLSCHQSGWDSSTTIFPSVSLTKSQSLTSLLPHEWSGSNVMFALMRIQRSIPILFCAVVPRSPRAVKLAREQH